MCRLLKGDRQAAGGYLYENKKDLSRKSDCEAEDWYNVIKNKLSLPYSDSPWEGET
jgi:hypothetical protein